MKIDKNISKKNQESDPPEPFIRIDEASRFLGLSKNFFYERTRPDVEKPIPCHRAGRYLLFRRSELTAWIHANDVALV